MIKVINRSDSNVTYTISDMNNLRRVFTPQEEKDIEEKELNALFQMDGGAELLKHYLMVTDKEWVEKHFEAPVEYFWGIKEIEKCLLEDSLELFSETLDYAPRGVQDLIKQASWRLPIKDLNKIEIIREKLMFDVQAAVKIMSTRIAQPAPAKTERLRKREEA